MILDMKKYLFIILVALVSLASCNDFLIEEPKLTQSDVLTLSSYEGLNKATLGAYSPLYSSSWYGANFVLASELRGGNAKNPTNTDFTSGRYTNEYNWSFNPSITSPVWSRAYYVISAANNVLNNLEGKEETGKVETQDLDNLKAECLFLRSLSYFDLVRTYAQPYTHAPESPGVPIVLETIADNKPARNTVKEVYDQIVADLLAAETAIDPEYTRGDAVKDPAAVVSLPAIQALLSRVYLYMGEWQKAADYATKVINAKVDNANRFSLWTAAEYENAWGNDYPTGGEIIFEVYGSKGSSYNGSWDEISYMVNPEGYADVASTADLRDLFEEGDVRGEMFVSHPDAQDHFWTLKYPGKGEGTPDANNIVVLRLSEMYLNRAEALHKGATISGVTALGDLNAVATIRGAAAHESPSDNAIFNERRKELCFEGHIVYDFARNKRNLVRVDYNGQANQNIDFPNYRWAMPIPKTETDANPNIVQNDNY